MPLRHRAELVAGFLAIIVLLSVIAYIQINLMPRIRQESANPSPSTTTIQPSSWVSSDSNFITVGNSYYKIQIRRDSVPNHQNYGGIEDLYLKPSNTQIVSPLVPAFGGDEYNPNAGSSMECGILMLD
jgi:hypothetical protein